MSSSATTLALLLVTTAPAEAPEAAAPDPAPATEAVAAPAPEAVEPAPAPVAAPTPAAPEPEPAPETEVEPVALAVEPAPVEPARVRPPVVLPPSSTPAHWEPQRPDAISGRWLVISSIGLGAASWGLTVGQVGMLRNCGARLDDDLQNRPGDCLYGGTSVAALGGLKALVNVSNWGVAGSAGGIKGNYDAIDHVWSGRPSRRSGLWIGGGFGLAIAGMTTAAAAASFTFGGDRTCQGDDCSQQLAGYLVASQVAQSMFTAGVGMAAYGMVYRFEYKENDSYKNRLANVRAAPVISSNFAGASLSGRF